MNYDIIGDIHGHADKLEALLVKMGYRASGTGYKAPVGHQAVFVGDLIDRGPKQLRVLEIARAMIDTGDARAVMGNHEFNAIGFATRSAEGGFLRPHSKKNREQHAEFLAEVGEDSAQHRQWVDWFKTLPLFLDLGGVRVAHAWWDSDAIDLIEPAYWDSAGSVMSDDFLHGSYVSKSPLALARKVVTCGIEWELPEGIHIEDKAGHKHGDVRLAVWRHWAKDLSELALVPSGHEDKVPVMPIPSEIRIAPVEGSPVLFGHHWFSGSPVIETSKVACLDWSAAKDRCPLVAYRWSGDSELSNDNFVGSN